MLFDTRFFINRNKLCVDGKYLEIIFVFAMNVLEQILLGSFFLGDYLFQRSVTIKLLRRTVSKTFSQKPSAVSSLCRTQYRKQYQNIDKDERE